MSPTIQEAPIAQRVSQPPTGKLAKLKDVRPRDLGFRFLAGAVPSIVAGIVGTAISTRVGGFFLAFPATLTLISR